MYNYKLFQFAFLAFVINIFYTFLMFCENGGFLPLLFRSDPTISERVFLRRRSYGIEFWISTIGAVLSLYFISRLSKHNYESEKLFNTQETQEQLEVITLP